MKQFKKVLSLLLVLCLTAAMFTGCGKGGDDTPGGDGKNPESC